jgi:O-antigen ligase
MPLIPEGLAGVTGAMRSRRQLALSAVILTVALGGAMVVGLEIGRAAIASGSTQAGGVLIIVVAVMVVAGFALTRDPSVGILVWLTTLIIVRLTPGGGVLAIDRLAFLALVGAWFLQIVNGRRELGRLGMTEVLMLAFVVLNIASAAIPHALAVVGEKGEPRDLTGIILTGAFLPFAGFVLARQVMIDRDAVRRLLWFTTIIGIYLAVTNVLWLTGPKQLVWPPDIFDESVGIHVERARGIFLNAAVTGYALVVSFATTMYLARQARQRLRPLLITAAILMIVAIGLTQTRSAWLAAALVVVFSAIMFKGFRRWYIVILIGVGLLVGANWQKFTSSDREQGGVASSNEADDRLNSAATALWAIDQKPFFGWGLGTFPNVNAVHHKAWGDTPWERGYGIFPHDTQLGIGAELGIIGLGLWLLIIGSILMTSRRAWQALPRSGLISRELVIVFWSIAIAWAVTSTLIDMRLFAYANAIFFVFGGMCAGLADAEAEAARRREPGGELESLEAVPAD